MPSIKQVEAFYWSGQLGSFVAAAERLNTTQSNISKRIQELEYALGIQVFDRTKRAIRLTAKGNELMARSDALLRAHLNLRKINDAALVFEGPFRFGVTEAIALTWLPQFSSLIQSSFSGLIPISAVETSANLNNMLTSHKIDLAIGTRKNFSSGFDMTPLVVVERVWVASPKLIPHDRVLDAEDLARIPIIGHGDSQINDKVVGQLLAPIGAKPRFVTSCRNLSALASMAIEGMGMTYLHKDVFAHQIEAGLLKIVRTVVDIPALHYVAACRNDAINPVAQLAAAKAIEVCNFRRAAAGVA